MAGNDVASSGSGSTSSTFLEQLRAGRPEAWERFVRLYGPLVYRWRRRSGLAAEDAADVLQEVLSAVMRSLPGFHRDRPGDSFGGWLAAITRNKVRDHFRRRHGRAEAPGGTTAQASPAPKPPPLLLTSWGWKWLAGQLALLLLVGGLGFALGITIRIHKEGLETTVEVPDGSHARVTPDGQVDVTLPSHGKPADAPRHLQA